MWNYEKRLQYPVKITQTNPKMAQVIISQFGGPDGELAASMRYLSQRYTMPYKEVTGILTDIGTEESAKRSARNTRKNVYRKRRMPLATGVFFCFCKIYSFNHILQSCIFICSIKSIPCI